MKQIINIPEEVKKDIDTWKGQFITDGYDLIDAVKNGIPLDDIRQEIEQISTLSIEDGSDGYDDYIDRQDVLDIIDKYIGKEQRCQR